MAEGRRYREEGPRMSDVQSRPCRSLVLLIVNQTQLTPAGGPTRGDEGVRVLLVELLPLGEKHDRRSRPAAPPPSPARTKSLGHCPGVAATSDARAVIVTVIATVIATLDLGFAL